MRLRFLIAVPACAVVLSGCGNSVEPPTATVGEGITVPADRYLADVAAGAGAVRAFVAELAAVGEPATATRLQAIAPRLEVPLATANLVRQRLSAERLADRRLDEQRRQDAGRFDATVAAMERVHAASVAGDPDQAKQAAAELDRSIGTLRDATTR